MGKWVQAENMKLEKGEERDRGNISMLRALHHNKKQWLGWGIEEGMQRGCQHGPVSQQSIPSWTKGLSLLGTGAWVSSAVLGEGVSKGCL